MFCLNSYGQIHDAERHNVSSSIDCMYITILPYYFFLLNRKSSNVKEIAPEHILLEMPLPISIQPR